MILFILGFVLGGLFGVFLAVLIMAHRDDSE